MKRIALGLLVGCSTAPPPRMPASPAPKDLAFYAGKWSCQATVYDDSGKAASQLALEVGVDPDIANWFAIHVSLDGKRVTSELKGFDAKTGLYRHLWTSEDGTAGSLSSRGWTGNQLVFDEDHPVEAEGKTRMTFTKIDDDHYTHRAEIDRGAGYKVQLEKACKRVPS